jgi:hypothetical protein
MVINGEWDQSMLKWEQNFTSSSKVIYINDTKKVSLHLFLQKGTHGGNFLGDMAIDDLLVTSDSQCIVPTTTTTTITTTTLGRYTPLSCNFEIDTCRWTDDTTASGRWTRHKGQADDFHTGPHYGKKNEYISSKIFVIHIDHTLQTADGSYIDTSNLTSNQTARLISTMTSITTRGICFRFWYRVYGSKQGRFNLLQKASNEQNSTTIYTLRGNQDIDWREAIVYRQTVGNYQFILEGIVGTVLTGSDDNIAIDDITTSEGMPSFHLEIKFITIICSL